MAQAEPGAPPRAPLRGDRGTGLIGTVAAVSAFLVFLLFAVQLLVGLYGRTVVTSAAYDGARRLAGQRAEGRRATVAEHERIRQQIRDQLGAIGRQPSTQIVIEVADDDVVRVRVEVDNPRFLPASLVGPLATDHISRTVVVRVEKLDR